MCNTSNQKYTAQNTGQYKVDATRDRIIQNGFTGVVGAHRIDINKPEYIPEDILQCNLFVSAVDSYESRVNFSYYVVQEAYSTEILYVDAGTERFKGHCFYVAGKSPCIYCVSWLFPAPSKKTGLCSIRRDIPEYVTEETRSTSVMSILGRAETETGKTGRDLYEETAREYNRKYTLEITAEEVEEIEGNIQPNTPAVSSVVAAVVCLIVRRRLSGNFIGYSGDSTPTFQKHTLSSAGCILCRK